MNETKIAAVNNEVVESEETLDDIRAELEAVLAEMSHSYIIESF